MPSVSVVVPIYKVQCYLPQCVDSLLMQTLADIEVILVDDGSPDSSGVIADGYAAKDSRVKVIHRENGGLGPARNTGIAAATGEYIGFVDADDWVEQGMFERLYQVAIAERADIVVGGYETWSNGKRINENIHPLADRTLSGRKEIEPYRRLLFGRLPEDGNPKPWPVEVWTSIYKSSLINGSGIRFENILSEDVFFNLEIGKIASRISHVSECGYHYRKDFQPSITNFFDSRTTARYLAMFRRLIAFAGLDDDPDDAFIRVGRKILDSSRTYTCIVEKSNLGLRQKVAAIGKLAESPEFIRCSLDYPISGLSHFQALFHRALVNGNYRVVLALAWVRTFLRGGR